MTTKVSRKGPPQTQHRPASSVRRSTPVRVGLATSDERGGLPIAPSDHELAGQLVPVAAAVGRDAGQVLGERLHGDRDGQYSVRINEQYRICFRWEEGYADDVEVTDYH